LCRNNSDRSISKRIRIRKVLEIFLLQMALGLFPHGKLPLLDQLQLQEILEEPLTGSSFTFTGGTTGLTFAGSGNNFNFRVER